MGLTQPHSSRRVVLCAVRLALLAALLVGLVPASALAGGPHRVGSKPAVPSGARAEGALAQGTQLTLTVTLQPRDPAGLAAYAQQVATPGSSIYHRYLSVGQFASAFGPTSDQIAAVRRTLWAQGLSPGTLAANHLSFAVTASAGRLAHAFNTGFERYQLRNGRNVYANTSAPQLSGGGASVIQGVLGLDDLARFTPRGFSVGHPTPARRAAAQPRTSGSSAVSPCSQASGVPGAYTANQIAGAYGFNPLYGAGDQGAGVTVAMLELEPYDATDINTYKSCYGVSTSVTNVPVDTGSSCPAGAARDPFCGIEDVLDIEDVIGLAPKSNIKVYEGPNSGQGMYDTYSAMIGDNVAKVISTSWGLCESRTGAAFAGSENTLFQEAATQGQTIFAASGDNGADDCGTASVPAVDDPASQPFVTGVGGTSLASLGPPPSESVWNGGTGGGSGGGGVSTLWSMPAYQSGFARSQSLIACPTGSGNHACRQVPDVSASADPSNGYAIYWKPTSSTAAKQWPTNDWGPIGGTSAAAPTWASLTALADASSACTSPIGFANPGLYAAARSAYSTNFNDVTSGSNAYDGVPGYQALTGYDMASGLGSPKGSVLVSSLCGSVGDSVHLTRSPGRQQSTAGRAISPVTINATSSRGANPITYSASGLPSGLSISRSSGRVTGTPKRPGRYAVILRAVDRDGMLATDSLIWTVSAPKVRLGAVSRKKASVGGSVRIVLHATDSVGAPITYRARHLPAGLSINRHTGVISGRPSRRGTRRVTVRAMDAFGGSAKRRFTIVVG